MSLRIHRGASDITRGSEADPPDGWTTRLAKLIPAEALGLYGVGSSMVPIGHAEGLWIIAGASLLVSGLVRFKATQSAAGRAQFGAIAIAMVSFSLWVVALRPPTGPLDLGSYSYLAALAALIWATVLPLVYKGD